MKTGAKGGYRPSDRSGKLKIMSLGGLQEIGKNMTVLEYGNDIIVVDCGMAFPDEEMPGVDYVIPDVTYLVKNADKVRGILITHGHEDHIGAIPYVLAQVRTPIYGTRLSLGIIEGKLAENHPDYEPDLYTVEAGDTVDLGVFRVEFVHVNHSIADACALAIRTPVGTVFHTGDFKIDVSPIDGKMIDLTRIGEIGREGVELLLCESTNAERAGFTPSERTVGSSLERIFMQYEDRRILIATFSSNVHRVQQIIDASYRHGRKVAVMGRSMVNVIGAATELGYMDFPEDVLIDISEIKRYKPEQITIITTGSQGEPMSALYRIAFSENEKVKIDPRDVVILSSSAIPGNEKLIGKIINALVKSGVKVVNDSVEEVHVSGHACREEIKMMIGLLKPKYFVPIHGESRHLYANKENAEFMGIPSENILISEIGKVIELDKNGIRFHGTVPSGNVLVDGSGVGDIGSVVLRDRKHLSEDGLVVVVATVDLAGGNLLSGPDIVSRGFVYVKESEELMDASRRIVAEALTDALDRHITDWAELKSVIRDSLAKFIFQKTKRKPMILPVIMEL
ncbi:MAG TPA: ribonuclease J [Clostridiales bacterium]|nr:ribonuclease J [Clostridiales bacterium]